jgi:hypothetical protein
MNRKVHIRVSLFLAAGIIACFGAVIYCSRLASPSHKRVLANRPASILSTKKQPLQTIEVTAKNCSISDFHCQYVKAGVVSDWKVLGTVPGTTFASASRDHFGDAIISFALNGPPKRWGSWFKVVDRKKNKIELEFDTNDVCVGKSGYADIVVILQASKIIRICQMDPEVKNLY